MTAYRTHVIFLLMLLLSSPATAVIISFSPSSDSVNINAVFDIDIVISDLYAADSSREIVSAFDLDILYDSALLNATAVTFGSLLGDPDFLSFETITDSVLSPGRIDLFELSLLTNADLLALQPNDSFTLATLSFKALAVGSSLLTFDPLVSPGINVTGYDPLSPFALDNTAGQARVNVVAAAEPGILFLFLTGLLGLTGASRKSFKNVNYN